MAGHPDRVGVADRIPVAFCYFFLNRGEITGHAAGSVAALCLLGGITVANFVGIGVVGWDVVQEQLSSAGGSPIEKALALALASFLSYGIIPSLQALVCGGLLGHWLSLLRD